MFIVFEGIDGTGKGTQIRRAVDWLSEIFGDDTVVETKEPGGTPLGNCIREIIYEKVPMSSLSPGVVDLLFFSSHLQNWQTVVKPALDDDKIVVCDRWWYSQEAYMRERPVPEPIAKAYLDGHGGRASLFIFLYGNVEKMHSRANSRTSETHQATKTWNQVSTLTRIQYHYFDLFSKFEEFCPVCVDDKDPDQVWKDVRSAILPHIEARLDRGHDGRI